MNIPHAVTTLPALFHVPLDADGARCIALGFDNKVGEFDAATVVLIAYLENRLWVIAVLEDWAVTHNNTPCFAHNLGVCEIWLVSEFKAMEMSGHSYYSGLTMSR